MTFGSRVVGGRHGRRWTGLPVLAVRGAGHWSPSVALAAGAKVGRKNGSERTRKNKGT